MADQSAEQFALFTIRTVFKPHQKYSHAIYCNEADHYSFSSLLDVLKEVPQQKALGAFVYHRSVQEDRKVPEECKRPTGDETC
jgi:hypothetical protein